MWLTALPSVELGLFQRRVLDLLDASLSDRHQQERPACATRSPLHCSPLATFAARQVLPTNLPFAAVLLAAHVCH